MRKAAMRLAALVMLAVILFAGLLTGNRGKTVNGEVTEPEKDPPGEIYVYIRSAKAKHQTEGGYLVEVEFTTDTPDGLSGMRMVTVCCEKQQAAFSLTEDNLGDVHSVSFLTEQQPETVTVEVRAHQTEAGLLLISDGEGQLCGSASAPVNGDRILYLSGAKPCAAYQIYRIADLSDLLSGRIVVSSKPTVKEWETYGISANYATTLTTEADGTAVCNFTREGLEDGIYLAVGEGECFYVCLPKVDASGEFISSVVRISLKDGGDCT